MAELWAAFHGAWEVLALGAMAAPLAVGALAGAAARRAMLALLAVFTENGAAARLALVAPLAVRALLADAPDWVRRRGAGAAAGAAAAAGSMARRWQRALVTNLAGCLLREAGSLSERTWTHS